MTVVRLDQDMKLTVAAPKLSVVLRATNDYLFAPIWSSPSSASSSIFSGGRFLFLHTGWLHVRGRPFRIIGTVLKNAQMTRMRRLASKENKRAIIPAQRSHLLFLHVPIEDFPEWCGNVFLAQHVPKLLTVPNYRHTGLASPFPLPSRCAIDQPRTPSHARAPPSMGVSASRRTSGDGML